LKFPENNKEKENHYEPVDHRPCRSRRIVPHPRRRGVLQKIRKAIKIPPCLLKQDGIFIVSYQGVGTPST
jgi:hypothetical protein